MPSAPESSSVLRKTLHALSYNPEHKLADWVFYGLGTEELRDCVPRSNYFRRDPELPLGDSAELADYKGSGYDRGHLKPAGDSRSDRTGMRESFFLSNITPQPPRFNQGIWNRLEVLVRAWAKRAAVWVVTGPVLKDSLPTLGRSQISIPDAYYKVLLRQDLSAAVALALPTDAASPLNSYLLSIDDLEEWTGIDFFPSLSREQEARLESRVDRRAWNFRAQFKYLPCENEDLIHAFGFYPPGIR
jgi:endonuclease G